MNLADLLKKNIVMVPVVASVLVGTFTGVRYIVNLTDTINSNQQEIVDLTRDLKQAQKNITDQNTRLSSAEATWQMAENLYRQLSRSSKRTRLRHQGFKQVMYGDSQDELLFYRCINCFICVAVFYKTCAS
jgi:hypothetical protein